MSSLELVVSPWPPSEGIRYKMIGWACCIIGFKNWWLKLASLLTLAVFYLTSTACFSEVEFECFLMDHIFFFFSVTSLAPTSFYPTAAHSASLVWSIRAFECMPHPIPRIFQQPLHVCMCLCTCMCTDTKLPEDIAGN